MTFVIIGPGTYSPYPECLAIGNTCLAVGRMAAAAVKVLMSVHGLGMEVSNQAVPISYYFCIEERHGLPKPLGSEIDGRMEGIYFIEEVHPIFFSVRPDGKNVVYVPPPYERFVCCLS